MPSVQILTAIDYPGPGGVIASIGDGEPTEVVLDEDTHSKHVQEFTVAAAASKKVYDSSEDIATFTLMILLVDVDGIDVEIVVDANATVGTRTQYMRMIANVPMIFGQASFANNANGFAGTSDLIDTVTLKNNNADSDDAEVTVLAFL